MTTHGNRGRLNLRPLGHDRQLVEIARHIRLGQRQDLEVLAEYEGGDYGERTKPGEQGWLVRLRASGHYMILLARGPMRSVDQRKARNALAAMTPDTANAMLAAWRREKNLSQSDAAMMLGVSVRTYEGWEQGRPMPYPRILSLALKCTDPALTAPRRAAPSEPAACDTVTDRAGG